MKNRLSILVTLVIIIAAASCKKETTNSNCGMPTAPVSSALTATSATLAWTAVSGVTGYNVQYRIQGSSTWTSIASLTTATTNLSGLTAGTKYEWQIQSICSGGPSAFTSSATFTTSATGPAGHSLVKTMTDITLAGGVPDTVITSYQYDNQNRMSVEILYVGFAGLIQTDTITFTYTSSTVTATNNSGGVITYNLNPAGFVSSDNDGDSWTYNSGNYVISSAPSFATSGATQSYTYNSLNQVATLTINAGGSTTVNTYTYAANPPSTGAGSTWLTGQSTNDFPSSDALSGGDNITYTYITDSQNRPTQQTATHTMAGQGTEVIYYTYY